MNSRDIIVTTGDLKRDYDVVGPVYYQLSNRPTGMFGTSSHVKKLAGQYKKELQEIKNAGQTPRDWNYIYGEFSIGGHELNEAFFVAVQGVKEQAAMLEADAVIGMRQDTDIYEAEKYPYFYLQMYGTAVKFK